MVSMPVAVILVIFLASYFLKQKTQEEVVMAYEVKYVADAPDYKVEFLDINEYSTRHGTCDSQRRRRALHGKSGDDRGAEPQLLPESEGHG